MADVHKRGPRAIEWLAQRLRALPASTPLAVRIALASAVLAALVVGAFAVLVLAISSLRETTSRANRTKDMTAASLRLEKHVVDLETALRGFLITGNERFLKPWREARAALPQAIAGVERLAAGNPAQERKVRELAALIEAYIRDYSIPLVAIARRSPAAARASVATAEGRRRFEAIRRRFARVLAVEDAVAASRVASAKRQATRAVALGLGALGASALLILLFGVDLARGIARPVRRAATAASEVAMGDLTTRLPEGGPGEIAELTRAFNVMAESLERGRRELEAQNEQLRVSERLRSELIGIVSHEIRTPLASVLGYTTLLLTRDFDNETRRRYLEIIAGQGRRLAALIDEFLDVRRVEDGALELREQTFDLAALLREQVRIFSGQSEVHSIELDVSHEALVVRGDPDRLSQVVANLLTNAIKYSPEGGRVQVSAGREGETVRVHVRDEGLGIAAEHQSRIFTKFFRGESRARGIGGAGLGLAISREIVEAHGGRMGFTSSVGEGSLFWFELPPASVQSGSTTGPAGKALY